jgi:hypothetical protein
MHRYGLLVFILLCWGKASAQNDTLAVPIDSLSAVDSAIYPDEKPLYPERWLDIDSFRIDKSGNYFGVYSLTDLQAYEWSKFQALNDPRLQVKPQRRPVRADYYFYVLLAVFLGMIFSLNRDQSFFVNMFRAVGNYRLSLQVAREQVANRTAASLVYTVMFNLLFALFLVRALEVTRLVEEIPFAGYFWLVLFALITAIYLVKYAFYKFLGVLFGLRDAVSYYLSQVFLMNRVAVLLLLPALIVLYYAPPQATFGVVIAVLLLWLSGVVLRYIRGIRISASTVGANSVHFILYFCAVEILPTLILFKLLLNV